eukprot:PhF_6_TR29068/c0_g1_i1/m.42362
MERQESISFLPSLNSVLDETSFIFGFDDIKFVVECNGPLKDLAIRIIQNWGGKCLTQPDESVSYILSERGYVSPTLAKGRQQNIPIVDIMWLSACSDCGRLVPPSSDFVIEDAFGTTASQSRDPSVGRDQPQQPTLGAGGFGSGDFGAAALPEEDGEGQGENAPAIPLKPQEYKEGMQTNLVGPWHILHCCELEQNKNKYYVMELHEVPRTQTYRILTHYGRTDDLVTNPNTGRREAREYSTLQAAQASFGALLRQKLHIKGYREVKVSMTRVGTWALQQLIQKDTIAKAPVVAAWSHVANEPLKPDTAELVKHLYAEAEAAITKTFIAKINENGIETPLGALSVAQITKGEEILDEIQKQLFANGGKSVMVHLSTQLYTIIPSHLGGRQRTEVGKMVIDNLQMLERKRELLQLMKDMIAVLEGMPKSAFASEGTSLILKYLALRCTVDKLDSFSSEFQQVQSHFMKSQVRPVGIQVKNVFSISKQTEQEKYVSNVGNEMQLFHGSRIGNWVGILSRGLLLPKAVVGLGGKRTNVGWLGGGLYFTDMSCATTRYCTSGSRGTCMVVVSTVALGKVHKTESICTEIEGPPSGFDSVQGVACPGSDFEDNEFVVYANHRHRMTHLVEFTVQSPLPMPRPLTQEKMHSPSPAKASGAVPLPSVPKVAVQLFNSNPFNNNNNDNGATQSTASSLFGQQAAPNNFQLQNIEAKLEQLTQLVRLSSEMERVNFQQLIEMTRNMQVTITTTGITQQVQLGNNSTTFGGGGSGFGGNNNAFGGGGSGFGGNNNNAFGGGGSGFGGNIGGAGAFGNNNNNNLFGGNNNNTAFGGAGGFGGNNNNPFGTGFGVTQFGSPPNPFALNASNPFSPGANLSAPGPSKLLAKKTMPAPVPLPFSKKKKEKAAAFPSSQPKFAAVAKKSPKKAVAAPAVPAPPAVQTEPFLKYTPFVESTSLVMGPNLSTFINRGIKTPSVGSVEESQWIKKEDQRLRQLYATDRENPEVRAPFTGLVEVYSRDILPTFIYQGLNDEEINYPRILGGWTKDSTGPSIIPSYADFTSRLNRFTQNQLEGMDWSNVFMAGGGVLACMMHEKSGNGEGFKASDIDLFLYGLSDADAIKKIEEIYNLVSQNRIKHHSVLNTDIVRTQHAVTIVGTYPLRHIQIVLRMYVSPAEVLLGFDVDACTVGYTGDGVFATPRARRSLNKQINIVDMTRRSLTYEVRLFKYSKRGFAVAIPDLQVGNLKPLTHFQAMKKPQGLARLLALDESERSRIVKAKEEKKAHAIDPTLPARQKRQLLRMMRRSNRWTSRHALRQKRMTDRGFVWSGICGRPRRANWRQEDDNVADYENVPIPWGPAWQSHEVSAKFARVDKTHMYFSQDHSHVCVSTMEGVKGGKAAWCDQCKKGQDVKTGPGLVFGPIVFVRENPGRQLLTGSFHPVTDDKYYEGVYREKGSPEAPPILIQHRLNGPSFYSLKGDPFAFQQFKTDLKEMKREIVSTGKSLSGITKMHPAAAAPLPTKMFAAKKPTTASASDDEEEDEEEEKVPQKKTLSKLAYAKGAKAVKKQAPSKCPPLSKAKYVPKDDDEESEEDEEENIAPQKKKMPKLAYAKFVKGVPSVSKAKHVDPEEDDEESSEEKPVKKPATAKAPAPPIVQKQQPSLDHYKVTVTYQDSMIVMQSAGSLPSRNCVAAFDIDNTITKKKTGSMLKGPIPADLNDFEFLDPRVIPKLKKESETSFIVFFTNQQGIGDKIVTKDSVLIRIAEMAQQIGVPFVCFIATQHDYWRKPSDSMWGYFISKYYGQKAPDTAFFVGDAAGRPQDFNDSDWAFAKNVGIPFFTPEQYFFDPNFDVKGTQQIAAPRAHPGDGIRQVAYGSRGPFHSINQEIVLLMGPPASGKSSFTATYFEPYGYVSVNQDTLKTRDKCVEIVELALRAGASAVVDNMNFTRDVRKVYIDLATKYQVDIRVLLLDTPKPIVEHNNKVRERRTCGFVKAIPFAVYANYSNNVAKPLESEGLTEVVEVPFELEFRTKLDEKLFWQYTAIEKFSFK